MLALPLSSTIQPLAAKEKGRQRLVESGGGGGDCAPESLGITGVLELSTTTSRKPSPAFIESSEILDSPILSCSEGALQQAVAATPSGADLLGPKPFHHVACMATMPTGQAEVG